MTTSDAGDHVPTTTAAESLWLAGRPDVRYPGPPDRHDFDVLVLGGGITGLTTALLLTRRGARVAVLEAGRIGSGVTGNNTGKVTALQSTMLSTIERTRGRDVAAAYAERSLAGVELVAALVAELGLDCDFRRRAAYTVAAEQAELRAVEKEAAAATRAGLPVETTDEVDLPFPVAGAVRLDDQVEIDPVRYAHGLATAIEAGGSRVLEGTRATAVSAGSRSWSPRTTRSGTGASTSRGCRPPAPTASPRGCGASRPAACRSPRAPRAGRSAPRAI
jgi:glycine/D-amino acid oxidase-like deaminating enzyme